MKLTLTLGDLCFLKYGRPFHPFVDNNEIANLPIFVFPCFTEPGQGKLVLLLLILPKIFNPRCASVKLFVYAWRPVIYVGVT